MTSIFRKIKRRVAGRHGPIATHGANPKKLSNTQKQFVRWNAQRLGISPQESEHRYCDSWRAIEGGHRKADYRAFNDLSYDLYQVFYNDNESEIYSAYVFHGPMHFLRMLSYSDPQWSEEDPIIRHLNEYQSVDIVDYGCGLAQRSRALAAYLKDKGIKVKLVLVDIPTIRKDFLLWMGEQNELETVFLDCTEQAPIPALPDADICIATEFFEHVYDPLPYFNNINQALRDNALLVSNIADHKQEFMHVSPNLAALREEIQNLNYDELEQNQLFRKRAGKK